MTTLNIDEEQEFVHRYGFKLGLVLIGIINSPTGYGTFQYKGSEYSVFTFGCQDPNGVLYGEIDRDPHSQYGVLANGRAIPILVLKEGAYIDGVPFEIIPLVKEFIKDEEPDEIEPYQGADDFLCWLKTKKGLQTFNEHGKPFKGNECDWKKDPDIDWN